MIEKIKKYLIEEVGQSEQNATYNCNQLAHHEDIVREYANWIDTRDFACENPVTVEGWTAQKLHERFPRVDDYTIFVTLRLLRDRPSDGHMYIKSGFAIM